MGDFDAIDNGRSEDDAISESGQNSDIEDNFKVGHIDFEPCRSSDITNSVALDDELYHFEENKMGDYIKQWKQ